MTQRTREHRVYPHLKMTDQKIHGSPIDLPAINKKPDLQEKIAFLHQVAAYPDHPSAIETVETHMFWVFLTDHHAYKLKKAVRVDYLDFSTLERRHRDCQEEVRLNRRLVGDVYQAVVPLSLDKVTWSWSVNTPVFRSLGKLCLRPIGR